MSAQNPIPNTPEDPLWLKTSVASWERQLSLAPADRQARASEEEARRTLHKLIHSEGVLQLLRDEGGPRHFLGGKPLYAGDHVEFKEADGKWVSGRYEWSGVPGDAAWFVAESGGKTQLSESSVLRRRAGGGPGQARG